MNATLERCHNISDLRALARKRLPSVMFDFMDGAAEAEITAGRNTSVFDDDLVIPRTLIDISSVQTGLTLFGQPIEWPVFCAPTGASRLFHPEGELAVARAAARLGTFYGLSIAGTHTLEAVAGAGRGPQFFQLLMLRNRELMWEMIERCRVSGVKALCLTVDTAARGKRERELRSGMGVRPRASFTNLMSCAGKPAWMLGQLRRGRWTLANLPQSGGPGLLGKFIGTSAFLGSQVDTAATWEDAKGIIERWSPRPFAIKGILDPDDARRAVDIGASAVIVSNHGGRQLDGVITPFEALPKIAAAVGDRAEVILDGGIRRGMHVFKALARGAKACSIGRPYLYGLAAGGESGAVRAMQILRSELVTTMQLSGCASVQDIDAAMLNRRQHGPG